VGKVVGNNILSAKKYDAVVVGSGPNGFAAAITLAKSDHSVLMLEAKNTVGGGMRSSDLTHSGCIHDVCAAVYPLGVASPFFKSLELDQYGLEWINSPAPLAHPLDDGSAVLLEHSIDATVESLEADGRAYRKLMGPLVNNWDNLLPDILAPLHFPRHPLALSRFGFVASQSIAYLIFKNFRTKKAEALFAGMAARSKMPLDKSGTAAFGLLLGAAGHVDGWPIVKGGSQNIAEALKKLLVSLGGEVKTGVEVCSLDELPKAKTILLDVTPRQLASIAGTKLPNDYKQQLSQHQYGPGVFKMDWVLDGPVPWKAADCVKAATVHIGGGFSEIAGAEEEVWRGEHPENPFVLLTQPSLFDTTRAPAGKQTVWAYCHVPNGSTIDMSERIEAQIERFAPGFRDRILFRSKRNTVAMEADNPNYIGGDITGGMMSPFNLFLMTKPYKTPIKGVYICSSSMPPGPGVHGMCGYHAAKMAIREMF
jgi:phytoene dehydrogenase-like protein